MVRPYETFATMKSVAASQYRLGETTTTMKCRSTMHAMTVA